MLPLYFRFVDYKIPRGYALASTYIHCMPRHSRGSGSVYTGTSFDGDKWLLRITDIPGVSCCMRRNLYDMNDIGFSFVLSKCMDTYQL